MKRELKYKELSLKTSAILFGRYVLNRNTYSLYGRMPLYSGLI